MNKLMNDFVLYGEKNLLRFEKYPRSRSKKSKCFASISKVFYTLQKWPKYMQKVKVWLIILYDLGFSANSLPSVYKVWG